MSQYTKLLLSIVILTLIIISSCEIVRESSKSVYSTKLMKDGDYRTSIELYDKEIKNHPENSWNYLKRGNLYQMIGEHEKAVEDFNRCLYLTPNDYGAYEMRVFSLTELGRFDEAYADLQILINSKGASERIYLMAANYHYQKGEYDEAIETCEAGLIEYPDDTYLLNFIGYTCVPLEKYEEGIAYFDRALAIKGRNNLALNNRGLCNLKLGHLQEAEKDVKKSLEIDASNSLAVRNMALIKVAQNKKEEGCVLFDRAIELGYIKSYGDDINEDIKEHCK